MKVSTCRACLLLNAGRVPIEQMDEEMRRLQRLRIAEEIDDTLIFVEHSEVITLGRRAQVERIEAPSGYPVFDVDRGGGLTWHGPGQLTVYPIFAWNKAGERSIRAVMDRLEAWIAAALARLEIEARQDERMRGAWVNDRKVASIGVSFRHWVTRHGLSINYDTPAGRVENVACCGLPPGTTTSLAAATGRHITRSQLEQALIETMPDILGREVMADAPSPARVILGGRSSC